MELKWKMFVMTKENKYEEKNLLRKQIIEKLDEINRAIFYLNDNLEIISNLRKQLIERLDEINKVMNELRC